MRCIQTFWKVFAVGLAAAACVACGTEPSKPKIAFDESHESKSSLDESISAASSGNWRELRTINTPHSYRNNYTRRWEVSGSPEAIELRVVFERFETENGYDFVHLTDGAGGQRTSHTGEKTGTEVIVSGNRLSISMTTDASVTGWGARLQIFERLPCICTEQYDPVCSADGQTYANDCFATCEGASIAHRGACNDVWESVGRSIESEHPYRDNYSNVWEIGESGATRIRVHFARIDLERGYDFISVLDANDRLVARYTGSEPNGITTPVIEGSLVKIKLETDQSITRFGFAIDAYEVQGGCASDSDCPSDQTCMQLTCIRAPCFNVCAPRTVPAYQTVSLTELEANPAGFHGQKISVVAEPGAPGAACTKIACSAANPCCNRCSANLSIGQGILLEDPSGAQTYTCGGNECTWQSSCSPFAAMNAGPYELRGTFTFDQVAVVSRLLVDSFTANACGKTGCSSHVCANSSVFTTCEYRPEYACYQAATCEAQADGRCGFTETPELDQCLANMGPLAPLTISARDVPLVVPDNDASGASSSISVPAQLATTRVRVSARVTHTYRGDLRVVLVPPGGREVVLHDRSGGSYDNVEIADFVVGELEGAAIGGDWKLRVSDLEAVDTGALESWSITLR